MDLMLFMVNDYIFYYSSCVSLFYL